MLRVSGILIDLVADLLRWLRLACRSSQSIQAALQQLREAVGLEERYEYLFHDRDSIFAKHLDESIERLGVKVLKSPPRSPMANAVCERAIGTIRRECLDWLIPCRSPIYGAY